MAYSRYGQVAVELNDALTENKRLHAFILELSQRLYLAAEVLSSLAERKTQRKPTDQSIIGRPEYYDLGGEQLQEGEMPWIPETEQLPKAQLPDGTLELLTIKYAVTREMLDGDPAALRSHIIKDVTETAERMVDDLLKRRGR